MIWTILKVGTVVATVVAVLVAGAPPASSTFTPTSMHRDAKEIMF